MLYVLYAISYTAHNRVRARLLGVYLQKHVQMYNKCQFCPKLLGFFVVRNSKKCTTSRANVQQNFIGCNWAGLVSVSLQHPVSHHEWNR